jgi:hypothetical protein
LTGHEAALTTVEPRTLSPTELAAEIFVGQFKVEDKLKVKGKVPFSGVGQYVNFVIPSLAMDVLTGLGEVQLNVGLTVGIEDAFILISKMDTFDPSVKVKVAVPFEVKVTANGVLMFEVVIFAPVKVHKTVVEEDMFVVF